ncbi:hypothetical protein GpartN1_g796.t1 [Galdieria partita]|uniref:Uncharacterized protein n=1 Tax=Galdieria partita TaxID=83374 RepID=A0A9C7PR55_9RHOD|nr:hypothetical protein GpartN1_g796.t1 [Galdieria partita]
MRRLVWVAVILAQLVLVFRDLHLWSNYPSKSLIQTTTQHLHFNPENHNNTIGRASAKLTLLDTSYVPNHLYMTTQVQKKKLAIVIPFIDSQIELLKFQLSCVWEQFPPCFCFSDIEQVDLILFFSGSVRFKGNMLFLEFLREVDFNSFSWRHCFEDIYLMSAELPSECDTHPEGTCIMFYQIFPTLENNYLYFQIIEPDVTPFRHDLAWLQEVVAMTRDHNDFWVKGSVSACPSGMKPHFRTFCIQYSIGTAWIDYHINGNALYKLGDRDFDVYLQRVQKRYVRKRNGKTVQGCSGTFYGGYDVSIFQYLYSSHTFEEWEYIQSVLHHFSYDTAILNYCNFPLRIEEIQSKYPNTVMIHSKWYALKRKYDSNFNCNKEHTICHSLKACSSKVSIR